MKIVCVDVRDDDDDVAAAAVDRGAALARGSRLLLFDRAAVVGARLNQRERQAREDAWLDDAAAWLLRDPGSANDGPPSRPAGGPLDLGTAVVSTHADPLTLQRTDRVVEMVGGLLVMAVPDADGIDAIDNAHLWLVGGGAFSITQHGPRAVVVVGDRVVVVSIEGSAATLVAHAFDGSSSEHNLALQVSSRLSVRSA